MPKANNSFDSVDLKAANDRLKTLPFYPSDLGAQAAVMEFLAKICPHRPALDWLMDALTERCRQWPGLADVRGLLCTRFKPSDGIETTCSLSGYRAQDFETRAMDESAVLRGDGSLAPASLELVRSAVKKERSR